MVTELRRMKTLGYEKYGKPFFSLLANLNLSFTTSTALGGVLGGGGLGGLLK
jgi:hypothetical protein